MYQTKDVVKRFGVSPQTVRTYADEFGHYLSPTRNAAHLPDYHRLDMNVSKKFRLGSMNFDIDLNVMNVYNRKNFFYFDTETGERVNMLPFLPSIDIKAEL